MPVDQILAFVAGGFLYFVIWLLLNSLVANDGYSQWWPRWKKIAVWAGLVFWPVLIAAFVVALVAVLLWEAMTEVLFWPFK